MNLTEEDNRKILIIVLVAAVIILGIYKIFFENKNNSKEIIDTETISIVTNPNDFYLVSSCISRFINYLSSNDSEKLFALLSNEYKSKNSITQDNIYSFISPLDGLYSFNPRKMYVQRIGESTYKYYVYGIMVPESSNNNYDGNDYYLVVILDRANTTFAVEPYSGDIF